MDAPTPEVTTTTTLTPAERHYAQMRQAQKNYYRRLHPNPRPRGRPPKEPKSKKPETSIENGSSSAQA